GGSADPTRHQRHGAVGERSAIARQCFHHLLQPQLAPKMPRDQHRSPIPRSDGVDVRGVGRRRLVAREHSQQRVRMRREQIFPTEVGDDAVLGPAFAPDRFHQPDVLVDAPTKAFDFHGAQEHSVSLSKTRHYYLSTLARSTTNSRLRGHIVSLGFMWIRQEIIVFRPFSEHSCVKGPKNLRTSARKRAVSYEAERLRRAAPKRRKPGTAA